MNQKAHPQALADAVTKRRAELFIDTQRKLAESADLSARMVGEIENARRTSYRDTTLLKIDRALLWAPGSARSVFYGGKPSALDIPHPHDEDSSWVGEDIEDSSAGEGGVDIAVYKDDIVLSVTIDREPGDREILSMSDLIGAGYEARKTFLRSVGQLRDRQDPNSAVTRKEMQAWMEEIIQKFTPSASPDSDVNASSGRTVDPVSYDEIAQAKLAEALQSDYMPAASPHEQPDPHDGAEDGQGGVR